MGLGPGMVRLTEQGSPQLSVLLAQFGALLWQDLLRSVSELRLGSACPGLAGLLNGENFDGHI